MCFWVQLRICQKHRWVVLVVKDPLNRTWHCQAPLLNWSGAQSQGFKWDYWVWRWYRVIPLKNFKSRPWVVQILQLDQISTKQLNSKIDWWWESFEPKILSEKYWGGEKVKQSHPVGHTSSVWINFDSWRTRKINTASYAGQAPALKFTRAFPRLTSCLPDLVERNHRLRKRETYYLQLLSPGQ